VKCAQYGNTYLEEVPGVWISVDEANLKELSQESGLSYLELQGNKRGMLQQRI
jgi:hypothetical protein